MKKTTLYNCALRYYTALKDTHHLEEQLEDVFKIEFSDNAFERIILNDISSMMFYILQDYMGEYKVDKSLLDELFIELCFHGEISLSDENHHIVGTITEPSGIIDWFIENKEDFDLLFPEEE